MKRIIRVEGYKAFHGIMKINYANPELAKANGMDRELLGDWLYKPDTDCWYCGNRTSVDREPDSVEEAWNRRAEDGK